MRNNVNMVKEVIKATKPIVPTPSSISVEVETIYEPSLDPPQEPETYPESSAPSSSTPVLPSIPETPDPILYGSDEEEEHPKAQTQALRDYQLARDRVRRVPKNHPRHLFGLISAVDFYCASAQLSSPLPNDAWASTCRIGCLGFLLRLPSGLSLDRVFYLLATSGLPLDRVTRDARGLGWPSGSSVGDPRDRSAFSSY
ncbi:hypothetical protein M9H77_09142 [Catharanthus roseus]|uniref:Uncharacterized protein n=1 Tax=Catharanthus roseus TaxID=4058 RepID=A0ACC0C028_CATRO|nr:hypothetical protein M9H77_09142 [Catharanthus roseus]